MTIDIEQLTQTALALPSEARALLAERLVESLAPSQDDEIQLAWTAEAVRRRDEIRNGSVTPVSRQEALDRIRRILP